MILVTEWTAANIVLIIGVITTSVISIIGAVATLKGNGAVGAVHAEVADVHEGVRDIKDGVQNITTAQGIATVDDPPIQATGKAPRVDGL